MAKKKTVTARLDEIAQKGVESVPLLCIENAMFIVARRAYEMGVRDEKKRRRPRRNVVYLMPGM